MLEKIIETIALHTKISASLINEDTNIFDYDIDSLGFLKIIMDIEAAFGIRFDDEEIVELRTAKDIENAILIKFK